MPLGSFIVFTAFPEFKCQCYIIPSAETVAMAPPREPLEDFSSNPWTVGLHLTHVNGIASRAACIAYNGLCDELGGLLKAGVII